MYHSGRRFRGLATLAMSILVLAGCTDGTSESATVVEPAAATVVDTTMAVTTSVPEPASTTAEDALTVVMEYFDAFAAGEHDRMMSQLAESVEVSFCWNIGCSGVAGTFDRAGQRDLEIHNIAEGVERRDLECAPGEPGEQVPVTCTYEEHVSHTLAVGGQGVPIRLTAGVSANGIERFHREIGPPSYDAIGDVFDLWMEQHHPDADPYGCCSWASTDEATAAGETAARYAAAWGTYLAITGCEEADYSCGPITDPAATVEGMVAAYNTGNIDTLMAFFAEQSAIAAHPFNPLVEGREELRRVLTEDRTAAAEVDPYAISNVRVDGDTVTWDHVWVNAAGESWCAEGHSAVVDRSWITSWDFAPNPHLCGNDG